MLTGMWRRQAESRSEPSSNQSDVAGDDPLGNDIIVGPATAHGSGHGHRSHGRAGADTVGVSEPARSDAVAAGPASNEAGTRAGDAVTDDVAAPSATNGPDTIDTPDARAVSGRTKRIKALRARLNGVRADSTETDVRAEPAAVVDTPVVVVDTSIVVDTPVIDNPVVVVDNPVRDDPVRADVTADTGGAVAAFRTLLNRTRPVIADPMLAAPSIDDLGTLGMETREPGTASGPDASLLGDGGAPDRRSRGAFAMVSAFLAVGLAVAGVAGWQWGRAVNRQAQQSFDARATTVSNRVSTSLQRDADLSTALRTVVAQNPQLTNAQLSGWFSSLASSQTPEATGVMYIQRVPSADLLEFLVAMSHDPTTAFTAGGSFAVTPSGSSSPYCLTKLLALRPALESAGDIVLTPGLDWCDTSSAGALATARDTGQLTVTPLLGPDEGHALGLSGGGATSATAGIQTLKSLGQAFSSTDVFLTPVYGTTPTTTTARRQTITGWVGTMFNTGQILAGAVGSQDVQVSLSRVAPGGATQVVASRTTGSPVGMARTVTTGADGTWAITVQQPPLHGLQTGALQGTLVGVVGALLVLAVFSGLMALVVSRRRALHRVTEQTGELQHVTLHDALTGLPNRDLVVDRAERMLARSRRSQLPCAALTVGLDGFKAFNETYDHRTGDALLQAVAERLNVGIAGGRHGGAPGRRRVHRAHRRRHLGGGAGAGGRAHRRRDARAVLPRGLPSRPVSRHRQHRHRPRSPHRSRGPDP